MPNPLNPQFLLEAVLKFPVEKNYIGLGLLPQREVGAYELTWDVQQDENNLAGVYAVNGEIKAGHPRIYQQLFADVINIGAARVLDADSVMALRDPGVIGMTQGGGVVGAIRAKAERKVAEALADANSEVDASIEYLIINALRGSINWPPAGVTNPPPGWGQTVFNIDFKFDTRHTGNISAITGGAGVPWSTIATADPARDLGAIAVNHQDNAGVDMSEFTLVCSRHVIRHLANNTTFQTFFRYKTENTMLNFNEVKAWLQSQLGVNIVVYDAQYTYRSVSTGGAVTISRARFLPTNEILVIPNLKSIGQFSTAPAKANNWQTGKWTWIDEKVNPWVTMLGVGEIGFPMLAHPEAIGRYIINA